MYVLNPVRRCELTYLLRLARVVGGTDSPEARKKILGTIPLGRVVSVACLLDDTKSPVLTLLVRLLTMRFSVNQKT